MKKSVNKLITKSTCIRDKANNSSSDSEDTSDCEMSVPLYKHIFKKRRILNSSSESEENTAEAATLKQKKNANKFSWTRGNFQPIIHEFDDENRGIKVNINNQLSILDIFPNFLFGRNYRIHCRTK